jgi:hypothetical protein
MTDETRAAVVSLLRETADKYNGIAEAFNKLYGVDVSPVSHSRIRGWRAQHPIWDIAVRAREAVSERWKDWSPGFPSYEDCCLQAADLLEEGLWEP